MHTRHIRREVCKNAGAPDATTGRARSTQDAYSDNTIKPHGHWMREQCPALCDAERPVLSFHLCQQPRAHHTLRGSIRCVLAHKKLFTGIQKTFHRHTRNFLLAHEKLSTDIQETFHRHTRNFLLAHKKLSTGTKETFYRRKGNFPPPSQSVLTPSSVYQ